MTGRILSATIFGAFALIFTGGALMLWFECGAIATGKEPTISAITAQAIGSHPHVAVLASLLIGVVLGALATHFTNWQP